MKKLTLFLMALVFMFSITMAGCSCTDDNDPNTIRLCEVAHSIFYAPMYVAINNGYFEDEGLNVVLTNGNGADNVMTALLTNSADIGLMGPEATVYVASQGRQDLPKVFGQLTKKDGSFLVGRTNETFDWANLTNKTIIAGRTGGMPAMALEYVLNQKGLIDGTNVTLNHDISFANQGPAFKGGTGDYTTLFEPTASEFESNGFGYVVASIGEEAGEIPYTCFTANSSYLTKNKEQAKKFLKAVMKGYDYIMNATVNEIVSAVSPSFSTFKNSSIVASVQRYISIDGWADSPVMSESSYDRLISIMKNCNQLSSDVAYNTIIDNTIANEIISEAK